MALSLPMPVRVAIGVIATGIDHIRTLPEDLPAVPVALVGQAMRLSMRVQQEMAELATRGDQLVAQVLGGPEENPAWAQFDDDEPAPVTPLPRRERPAPAGERSAAASDPADQPTAGPLAHQPERSTPSAARTTGLRPIGGASTEGKTATRTASTGKKSTGKATGRPSTAKKATGGASTGTAPRRARRARVASAASSARAASAGDAPNATGAEEPTAAGAAPTATPPSADTAIAPPATVPAPGRTDAPGTTAEATTPASAPSPADPLGTTSPGTGGAGGPAADAGAAGTPAEPVEPAPVLPDYDSLTLAELRGRLKELTVADVAALLAHEQAGADRAPFVTMLSNRLVTLDHPTS